MHPFDWPYERAPLAAECADGWRRVAAVCREEGTVVLAGLSHAGGQGSSAYSQRELWAPSSVPDVASREVPKEMEHGGHRLRSSPASPRPPGWPRRPDWTGSRSTAGSTASSASSCPG